MKSKDFLNDEWSQKYKKSINCASPKGFSQRAHCAGRKKNEGVAEGSGGDQYKIKSIGHDSKGDYYISPSTGKKVYKSGVKRGDHENPKTGEHKSVAEGSDFFAGSKFADEEGNTFSVEKIIAFAKKNPKYFHKDFPLSKIKHDLSWWQGNKERMMNADTRFPLLVIQNDDGHLGVADGLNRMKKAVDVEKGTTIDVYLVPKKDIMKFSEKQSVAEATGDPKFDKMLKGITGKKQVAKQQKADTKQQARDAFDGMFGGGNPADKLSIRKKGMAEGFGRNRGYSHGFASPHAPSLGGRREREDDEGYGQEEQNNYAVVIDGRTWKVFADKQQAENIARSLRNKGKKASVGITGANPSESVTETDAEFDDDVFSDRKRLPPKNLHALLQWAGNDPEKRYFRWVANFGIKHNLNLAATLGTLSDFDAIDDDDLESTWGITDEREAITLFNAYEHVYNAWVPNNYDGSEEETWANESAEAELAEPPERPRKTTTKTKPDIKFDIPFQQAQDQPLAKVDPLDDLKKKAGIGDEPKVNIRKAKQKDTLSKTAGIGSDDMAGMLGKLRNIEVDRDLEAYPDEEPPEQLPSVEVNTANLPAVAGQALQAAGVQNPEFHQVANLPGNMADQIRQLGKSLFGSLTMTPTKRIHVVANLGGQGPNTSAEVNAVAGFLKDHGRDLGPGDIDFENVMPGYKAQTHMFTAAGIRWMLVKDFAGQYIYCWPEEDSHDAQDAIGQDQDVKKLK